MASGLFAAGLGMLGVVVFTLVLIADVSWDLRIKVSDLAAPYGIAAVFVAFGAYQYRVGVYHNDSGVRLEYLIYHRVVPWPTIAAIESRPPLTPSSRETRVIVLVTVHGAEIVTPLTCAPRARRGSWLTGSAPTGGRNLSYGDYGRALGILQRGLVAARRRPRSD
jgi:hypothetical protein